MLRSVIVNRWFPFFDLGLALFAGVLWLKWGARFGWVILALALLPWGIRAAAGQPVFRRTRLDGALLLFLVTAVLGMWTGVNFEVAGAKFWLIVGSIILFYALAGQSRRDVWLVAAGLGVIAAGIAAYFLLTNDWGAPTADYFGPIRSVGLRLMRIRPFLPLPLFHPNAIAGMIVILIPFVLASALYAWQKRRWTWLMLALACGGLASMGLLMTGSIGAWLALAVGLAVWLLWEVSGFVGRKMKGSQTAVFLALLVVDGIVGLAALSLVVVKVTAVNQSLAQRYDLVQETMYLIDDFSIIGGGLASFPSLYSEYIRVVPFFFVLYSNLFLDVWLEQSILGLLALLLIMGLSFWLLFTSRIDLTSESGAISDEHGEDGQHLNQSDLHERNDDQPPNGQRHRPQKRWSRRELYLFRWAAFVSVLVIVLHGLTDDALYGGQGTPFLFLAMGMAVVVSRRYFHAKNRAKWTRWELMVGGTAVLAAAALILLFQRPLLARWYANVGAGQMARVDLAVWPSNEWGGSQSDVVYETTVRQFNRALVYDPNNRTAHHRLGMIAMEKGNFATAVFHLETAFHLSPNHRGVRKLLGNSYVWLGQYDQALLILAPIGERLMEMEAYIHWWGIQQQPELAFRAEQMADILRRNGRSSP